MAEAAGGDEMESVKNYFNTAGFERWNKIYGTTSVRTRGVAHALPARGCLCFSDTRMRATLPLLRRVRVLLMPAGASDTPARVTRNAPRRR